MGQTYYLKNGSVFLLQIGAKTYCISGQICYYILGWIYCKSGQLLRISVSLLQIIGTGITNLGNYYKLAHSNCKKNCEITIVLNKRVASSAPMK